MITFHIPNAALKFQEYARRTDAPFTEEQRAYIQSTEFEDRMDLQGDQGAEDAAAIHLRLLSRVALEPSRAPTAIRNLEAGYLDLSYFRLSPLIPGREIAVGSELQRSVIEAVRHNMASQKFKAAKLCLSWQTTKKVWPSQARIRRLLDQHRSSLPFSAESRESDRLQMSEKERALKGLRQDRIEVFSRVACHGSWHDFLEDVTSLMLETQTSQPTESPAP